MQLAMNRFDGSRVEEVGMPRQASPVKPMQVQDKELCIGAKQRELRFGDCVKSLQPMAQPAKIYIEAEVRCFVGEFLTC